MAASPRLSHQGLRVLRAFLDAFTQDVQAELAGADLLRAARIQSGTLYPILVRLERSGLLESRWEESAPQELGRPRRRFYRLTPSGAELARKALHELAPPLNILSPREA